MWDYAWAKYRTAFPVSSGVTLSGPAYTGPPNEANSWWTKWAAHMKANPSVYPDVITYHQLDGRQASFNDPFESKRVLDIILAKNGLPARPVQINGEWVVLRVQLVGYANSIDVRIAYSCRVCRSR